MAERFTLVPKHAAGEEPRRHTPMRVRLPLTRPAAIYLTRIEVAELGPDHLFWYGPL